MHSPIEHELEEYLAGRPVSAAFREHASACQECSEELSLFAHQASMIRALRVDLAGQGVEAEILEPAPGFYARVMDVIEAQRPASIWSIFLQPFGQRLAYASLALAAVMGAYIVVSEPEVEVQAASAMSILATQPAVPARVVAHRVDSANPEENRHAVLAQLVAYEQ